MPEEVDVTVTFDSKGNFELAVEKEDGKIDVSNCKVGMRDRMLFINLGDNVEYKMRLVEIEPIE